jgi:hypothetical protein
MGSDLGEKTGYPHWRQETGYLCVIKRYAINIHRRVEVWFHTFITSTPYRGEHKGDRANRLHPLHQNLKTHRFRRHTAIEFYVIYPSVEISH